MLLNLLPLILLSTNYITSGSLLLASPETVLLEATYQIELPVLSNTAPNQRNSAAIQHQIGETQTKSQ